RVRSRVAYRGSRSARTPTEKEVGGTCKRARAVSDGVHRRSPRQRAYPQRCRRRMVDRVALLAEQARGFNVVLDAGMASAHALFLPSQRHRADDAHRQTNLAGRANVAHQRRAGCVVDLEEGRWQTNRDAAIGVPLSHRLELAPAAATAAESSAGWS